ncbi:MAG TPA: alanine racemase [Firmicutes bacterium]|nr:alanine racemase [Bacillota bacterium]
MRTSNVTKIEINLDNLLHNYHALIKYVGKAEVVPVIKSEAYGHGAVPIARALAEAGCRHMAIAMVDEGVQLRLAGISAEIMVLGVTLPEQYAILAEYDLTPTLNSCENLRAWAETARRVGRQLPFHLKVDIGLGRLGFLPEQAHEALQTINGLPEIKLRGISSHLSHPEGTAEHNAREFERYQLFCEPFSAAYPHVARHLAASEAILRHPHMYFDLVRVGGLLYGFDYDYPTSLTLKPVLSYSSKVGQVKTLQPGWGVGYGIDRLVQKPTRVALLPLGWSDGLSKNHIGKAQALIRGQFATLIGICTDFTMFDITHIPEATAGDEAVLVGSQGDKQQTIMQLAHAGGMSASELLGSTALRVARVYTRGQQVQEELSIIS